MGNPRLKLHRGGLASFGTAVLVALLSSCSASVSSAAHLSRGCREGHRVALTFDDGPNPPYTDQILDIMQSHHARATFFDEGQAAEAHPEIVRRELSLGMAVGSHSCAHGKDLPTLTRADFAPDLQQAEAALTPLLGYKPALYRAPYGHTSQNMLDELHAEGYVSIGWDVDSTDWSGAPVDAVVSSVLDHVHPGAIVLMHDGGLGGGNADRSTTIAALPRIIDGLRERGYSFVTVPEITGAPAVHGRERRHECSAS
jgi:peptidoglycan/xylan/chitin deacetylase (PgdA/CDA1 family)